MTFRRDAQGGVMDAKRTTNGVAGTFADKTGTFADTKGTFADPELLAADGVKGDDRG